MSTATLQRTSGRVSREKGIIYGVKILGLESRNGRTYTAQALRLAVPLYEGAKVNVNHPDKKELSRDRRYEERLGVIRNVRFQEGQGLYGDLHYNTQHALAAQLAFDAEHSPESVGFSPRHMLTISNKGGKQIVESIDKVISVDLVADPATTNGIFESVVEESIDTRTFAQRLRGESRRSPAEIAAFVESLTGGVDYKRAARTAARYSW